jgi:hypothetical protein
MNFRSCWRVDYEQVLFKRSYTCQRLVRQNPISIVLLATLRNKLRASPARYRDAAENLYDQAADSASQIAGATTIAARKTASSFEKALRNTIENQPYTAVVVALALGWLFGRMHRPL